MSSLDNLGTLTGVGVGPGDPDLLTLRALKALNTADLVVAPVPSPGKSSRALAIAEAGLRKRIHALSLVLPMTPDQGLLKQAHQQAARCLLEHLEMGKNLAYVTLGDPSLYSTFGYLVEEIRSLEPLVPVEVVPGVPAFLAAAAIVPWPLARGRERLLISPCPQKEEALSVLLDTCDSLALLKVGDRGPRVKEFLRARYPGAQLFQGAYLGLEGQDNGPQGHDAYLSTILIKHDKGGARS